MDTEQPVPHFRSYYYKGGSYDDSGQFSGQMYVEKLSPVTMTKRYPIVLVHGGCQSGTTWLNKPGGHGLGWANWFLNKGYEVFIVDQPFTSRSPLDLQSLSTPGATKSMSTKYIEERFTNTKENGLWPQAALHTQWPGTGKRGDAIFDAYYATTSAMLSDTSKQEEAIEIAGIDLLDTIGPAIILCHSQGSLAGWLWANARPNLVKALLQIEPKGPPYREEVPGDPSTRYWGLLSRRLRYDPPLPVNGLTMRRVPACTPYELDGFLQCEPGVRKLTNLKDVPILIETGEASYHAGYDHWTAQFLEQAGCEQLEHHNLADFGIHGNGHLQMLEKNSSKIAEVLELWIRTVVEIDCQH